MTNTYMKKNAYSHRASRKYKSKAQDIIASHHLKISYDLNPESKSWL